MRLALWVLALGVLSCCAETEGATPERELCGEDVPLVSWETFAEGFLTTYCQGCHASTAVDRQGAPPHIVFDTEDDALSFGGAIRGAAASEEPTMPPNGGPSEDDRQRLEIWITCFSE